MINKRKKGKWAKWVVVVVVIAILGAFAFPTIKSIITGDSSTDRSSRSSSLGTTGATTTSASTAATAGSYATVTKGDLSVTVYGSGSLSPASTQSVYTGAEGKIESINVEVGDTVSEGDVVMKLNSSDLETEIATLESELFAAQVALSDIRDSGSDYYVYSPSAGRVKMIAVEEGDDISMVMKQTGYLCVISRDGKMKVEFEPTTTSGLSVGDVVSVWIDNVAVEGVVDQMNNLGGNIAVTIADDTYDVGEEVLVTTLQGEQLGSGQLEVNMPIPVTAVGGTIDTLYYEDNEEVGSGYKLFYITGRIPSAELQQALLTYEEARVALDNAQAKQESLIVRAPMSGVITSVDVNLNQVLEESSLAFTMQSATEYKIVATVDELDIVDVEVGQSVDVEIDAFPDQTFTGTVKRISGVGTVSGGVASYEVTVLLDEASVNLMDGMTASVEIIVADKQDVLLVPVEAVSTANGQNYVTLADGQTSFVTIGASDDTNVEILSGVNEGDQVLITRTSSTSSSSESRGGMGGAMGGGAMGGGMPGGR